MSATPAFLAARSAIVCHRDRWCVTFLVSCVLMRLWFSRVMQVDAPLTASLSEIRMESDTFLSRFWRV